jgi:hypothetical protein
MNAQHGKNVVVEVPISFLTRNGGVKAGRGYIQRLETLFRYI